MAFLDPNERPWTLSRQYLEAWGSPLLNKADGSYWVCILTSSFGPKPKSAEYRFSTIRPFLAFFILTVNYREDRAAKSIVLG